MRVNKYPGTCIYCNYTVMANAGVLLDTNGAGYWQVAHLGCHKHGKADPNVIRCYSPVTGESWAQCSCIDRPCCGCV